MTVSSVSRYWLVAAFLLLLALPFLPGRQVAIYGQSFIPLFCYAILALGLNVIVGYTGLLHLGIAAFFGIGAYVTGILTVPTFPFESSFLVAVVAAMLAAAALGVVTTAPTLRLRGDYLALVTMGFGLITTFAIRNLEEITNGTKGLNPVSPTLLPGIEDPNLAQFKYDVSWYSTWRKYPYLYFLALGVLALVVLFLRNLERSRLGRAWEALREDELAASCMGLNPARLKLSAIALGAALAGLAGAFYAVSQTTTAGPQAYDFNRSMITLCCIILGGLGNRPGVLLGTFILVGYDQVLTPEVDNWLQKQNVNPDGKEYLKVSGWRLFIFGLALILMMRFRPEGLLPAGRVKRELHPEKSPSDGHGPPVAAGGVEGK
jgi:branched-chain amino acid transport system permease protein